MQPKIIEQFTSGKKTIALIQLDETNYCVRETIKNLIFKDKINYYVLNIRGTCLIYSNLSELTTIGTLERCRHIFNANTITMGKI